MSFLSDIDVLAAWMGYTETQKNWLIASIIIGMAVGLIVLAWLVYNSWAILFKQGRYRVLPLTVFYILAISLIAAHIITAFMFAPSLLEGRVLAQLIF